jgi:endoglucanase
MTDLLPFLKTLITAPGLSGYEGPAGEIIAAEWRSLTDEIGTSRLGSLHGLKRGSAPDPRPGILLAAHMDAIGLMVTALAGGLLRVAEIGGVDARVLPGQIVTVHGREDLPGVLIQPPPRLLPEEAGNGPVELKYLLVDVGLHPDQVQQLVQVGDLVSFAQPPLEMAGEILAGHSLDNRASVAALTGCLQELQGRDHRWDVWAVATVQEEVNLGGARTSAYQLRPALAVAIDVTWARGPGAPEHKSFPMGKGPTLGWGPNIHPGVYNAFKAVAERLEIPYQVEVMPKHSGTDAVSLQVAAEGIPTMVVSIPLRYMHTPVEMVALKDIRRTAHLLAEFITGLEVDFIEHLTWD